MHISSIMELRKITENAKKSGKKIALVPTMGYLHEGHLTLIREAKQQCEFVITSIFVNPLQFGPSEDFSSYPRKTNEDVQLAVESGSDIVFIPDVDEITPNDIQFSVDPGNMGTQLCGKYRPGHFRGVCTIVLKLFMITSADKAFFGWKDAQQFLILKKMVKDLNLLIDLIGVETQRDKNGLALSSRNVYLTSSEKQIASEIYKSLKLAETFLSKGPATSDEVKSRIRYHLERFPEINVQYLEIVNTESLQPIETPLKNKTMIAIAAFVGKARLIDNIRL